MNSPPQHLAIASSMSCLLRMAVGFPTALRSPPVPTARRSRLPGRLTNRVGFPRSRSSRCVASRRARCGCPPSCLRGYRQSEFVARHQRAARDLTGRPNTVPPGAHSSARPMLPQHRPNVAREICRPRADRLRVPGSYKTHGFKGGSPRCRYLRSSISARVLRAILISSDS